MSDDRIGVISDTHGLLRDSAVQALNGCSLIIHAGDVGDLAVIDQLEQIAPVRAVRGNMDHAPWAKMLDETQIIDIGGNRVFVIHDVGKLGFSKGLGGVSLVIYGHSHKPLIDRRDDILFFNPGSAGPRRFDYPVTVGDLRIIDGRWDPRIIDIA